MSHLRHRFLIAMDPVTFARQTLKFHPDAHQESILQSDARRGIICCSRQWGKSTVCALKAVHHALHAPESLILAISPVERQSAEFIRKAARFLGTLGIPRRSDGDNHLSLLLPNGSRIIGLPANERNIRGYSAVSILFLDEAARIPDDAYDTAFAMLAVSNGALWLLSTPFGQRGFFWKEWTRASVQQNDTWFHVTVPATECPRISPAFLADRRLNSPARLFAQEYMCEFTDGLELLFPRHLLDRAIVDGYPKVIYE